jgi:hypothetical protein
MALAVQVPFHGRPRRAVFQGPPEERYLADSEVSPVSTTTPSSPQGPERLQFSFAGRISVWDPIDRCLEIGTRHFWVVPGVSVTGVVRGAEVTVTGHVERSGDAGARWIVTNLTVH